MDNFFLCVSLINSLIALKAVTIGSDFNFQMLIRDGKKYYNWYKNREKYT